VAGTLDIHTPAGERDLMRMTLLLALATAGHVPYDSPGAAIQLDALLVTIGLVTLRPAVTMLPYLSRGASQCWY
jgi:hypothetical protein